MPRNNANPLDGLYEIVNDLWAHETTGSEQTPQPERPEGSVPAHDDTKPSVLPSFETLWKTADESIDWTDVLVSPLPTDGITPRERWDFLRTQVNAVLSGDISAYSTVLKEVRPLDDLKQYAHKIRVSCINADRINVTFNALTEDATQANEAYDTYLCGLAIRSARDLFAILPVQEVSITAGDSSHERVHVVLTRNAMRGIRFAFIAPAEFILQNGGSLNHDPHDSAQ